MSAEERTTFLTLHKRGERIYTILSLLVPSLEKEIFVLGTAHFESLMEQAASFDADAPHALRRISLDVIRMRVAAFSS